MNKILNLSVKLKCSTAKVFDMFTVNEHLQSWLATIADVEPTVGGKYELFWNPEDRENDSTIGCKITAIETGKYLSFEWKGPKHFKHFMNNADPLTHVLVFFFPCDEKNDSIPCTEVHIIHSGWKNSPEWEEARLWFEKAWDDALRTLRKKVAEL